MFENDEPDASLALNPFEDDPSHATGEDVYILSMFFLLKVSRFKNVSYVVYSSTHR